MATSNNTPLEEYFDLVKAEGGVVVKGLAGCTVFEGWGFPMLIRDAIPTKL